MIPVELMLFLMRTLIPQSAPRVALNLIQFAPQLALNANLVLAEMEIGLSVVENKPRLLRFMIYNNEFEN